MIQEKNPGCELDLAWLNRIHINERAVTDYAVKLTKSRPLKGDYRAAWLIKAITCIDLTTLAGDDTNSNVSRLCYKAARPVAKDLLSEMGLSYNDDEFPVRCAAVCVYPARVKDAVETIENMNLRNVINVASVATGFPSGQTPLKTRLEEIKYAIQNGANEIDIVIDRNLVLTGKWELLYQEIQQMREACSGVHMKSILATGELASYTNIYKASLVAMMAGSDFIKTSTGKETVNATLPVGIVMARAIKDYHHHTNYMVGLKPAGGIKTSTDAINWLVLVKEILGNDWLTPELFRFGASGLLTDIENEIKRFVNKNILNKS